MTTTTTSIRLPFERALSGTLEDLVYSGAMTPHDGATGALVTSTAQVPDVRRLRFGAMFIDVPGDRAFAQAWQAYTNLAAVLEAAGSGIARLCRQRVFVRDLRDVPVVERVMEEFFDPGAVATTIVQIGDEGVDPDIALQVEGVALLSGAAEAVVLRDGDLDRVTGTYPAAVRAGQFVFVSGIPGINPDTGRTATRLDELGDEADRFDTAPYRSRRQHAILAQTWFTFQHVRRALGLAGAGLADILKVNGWLDFPMRDFDPMRPVRQYFFPTLEEKVASTALWVGPNPHEGSLLAYDAVAVAADEQARGKRVATEASLIVPYYVGATAGGGAVFTCGEVPVEEETPRAVTTPGDLEGSERLLAFGRLEASSGIEARAAYVYRKLEGHLRRYGSSLDRVVAQVVYLEDMREHSPLELVARSAFGGRLPATTTVPIRETSPFYREARLEIEVVAAATT